MPRHRQPKPDPFRDWLRERQGERFGIHNLAFALGCTRQTIYRWLAGDGVSRAMAAEVISHAQARDSVRLALTDLTAK